MPVPPAADVLTSDVARRKGFRFLEVVLCNEIAVTKHTSALHFNYRSLASCFEDQQFKASISSNKTRKPSYMLVYPNLKPTKRQIEHRAHPKCNLKPNVPRRFRNRAREPDLPHTRNRESKRGHHHTKSSYTRRQVTRQFQALMSYCPGSLCRNTRCSSITMATYEPGQYQ